MKIILTDEEAQMIARDRIRIALSASFSSLPVQIDVQVENSILDPLKPTAAQMDQCFKDIQSLNYKTHQKIQAIKRLREHIPSYGLIAAKYAVENWDTWKADAMRNGRWPTCNT